MDILGKEEPCDESGGRGGATIDPRETTIVVAVAIDTAAVAGISKGVRIVHPPAAIDCRPPPSSSSSRRYARATMVTTKYENKEDDDDDDDNGRRRFGGGA